MKEHKPMEDKETGRLEAFSDGVFAVAITLLVLNIRIPGLDLPLDKLPDDGKLWFQLLNGWPMLAAYITSFSTIGIMWLNHHRLYTLIKRTNTVLMLLNLLLLLVIVFIPVPTALLAEYILRPAQHAAAVVYSGTFLAMACCYYVLWRYASYHNRLLAKDADTHAVNAISRQFMFGPISYLIVFGIAFIDPPVSVLFQFLLAMFFAMPGRYAALLSKSNRKEPPADFSESLAASED
jgi:uncharacterized membrane protein